MSSSQRWAEQATSFLTNTDLAERTRATYRLALRQFGEWWQSEYGEDELDILALSERDVADWRDFLQRGRGQDAPPAKAATVNCKLAAIRALAGHFGRELAVKGSRQQPVPRQILTTKELRRLVRALRRGSAWLAQRNEAAVGLMCYAGLRVGEVVSLKLEDVHLGERSGHVLIRRGKGRKERTVTIPIQVRELLRGYLAIRPISPQQKETSLFVSCRGTPLSTRVLQRVVQEAARDAKIERKVTCHLLRHTYATRFIRTHKDSGLATLQNILGHASAATTMGYLHASQEEEQEMVEKVVAGML